MPAGNSSGDVTVTGTLSGCESNLASRAVVADQAAAYAAQAYGALKKISCYANGQVLYAATDNNGGITAATISSGTLPPGMALNTTTGELTVSNADDLAARATAGTGPVALVRSTTSFVVQTTDAQGGRTETPLTLAFNSDQAASVATAGSKSLQRYSDGEVLATYTDPDGTITSATLSSGIIPFGTGLRAQNGVGQLYVVNSSQLTPGTYTFTTSCTDAGCTVGLSRTPATVSIGNNQALPVTLTAFTARRVGRQLVLQWNTAQELNNDYFAVEQSLDGATFVELGRLSGRGTTSQPQAYEYVAANAPTTRVYYRLRQVDTDSPEGTYSAVRTVAAVAEAGARLSATAYPNPATGRVELAASIAPELQVSISTPVGTPPGSRTLLTSQPLVLDLSAYPAGLYLLHLRQGGQHTVLRVVKE